MNIFYSKEALILLVIAVGVFSFCAVSTHHMASIANMSPSCGASYLLTILPQPAQEKGAFFAFFGLLVLSTIYFIARTKAIEDVLRKPRLTSFFQEDTRSPGFLVELFSRGILNPKIYDSAFVR